MAVDRKLLAPFVATYEGLDVIFFVQNKIAFGGRRVRGLFVKK